MPPGLDPELLRRLDVGGLRRDLRNRLALFGAGLAIAVVGLIHDEQRRRLYFRQPEERGIGPAAARYDGRHVLRALCRSEQRYAGADAGGEVTERRV